MNLQRLGFFWKNILWFFCLSSQIFLCTIDSVLVKGYYLSLLYHLPKSHLFHPHSDQGLCADFSNPFHIEKLFSTIVSSVFFSPLPSPAPLYSLFSLFSNNPRSLFCPVLQKSHSKVGCTDSIYWHISQLKCSW